MTSIRETTILALETSGAACSVALWRSGGILGHRFRVMERGHAEALVPMVQETLREASIGFAELSAIGVTVGPGSFTGLRAGLAAARGFALSRGLPLVGVDSFEAIAHAVPEAEVAGRSLVVAIDTRRRDLYVQAFGASGDPLGPGTVISAEAVVDLMPPGPLIVAGDGRHMLLPLLRRRRGDLAEAALDAPDARDVAAIAAFRLQQDAEARPAVPLYLREPEAAVPKWGGRLRP